MLSNAEEFVCRAIGSWSTVPQLMGTRPANLTATIDYIDITADSVSSNIIPGQFQALLVSDEKFIWFIEQWDVVDSVDSTSGLPSVNFINKKVYPAKVQGLNIPLFNFLTTNNPNLSVTMRWREGLIRHSNFIGSASGSYSDANIPCYRPGFGQQILSDLQRPLKSKTIQCNSLGLVQSAGFQAGRAFNGPHGRLMAMAATVDEKLGKAYDASQSKKKKVPLNSQDKEQIPTYPTYNTWIDNSGY